MTTYNVSTTEEFITTLKAASGGDTILLAPGAYSDVDIKVLDFDVAVTIKSADPENRAVLHDLVIFESSGLHFSELIFNTPEGPIYAFTTTKSSDIHFTKLSVNGPDNLGSGNEVSLFFIRESTDITVSESEFSQGKNGIIYLNNNNILIENNYFHDIRADGVAGGGTSNITITNNFFTDFRPNLGDHGDAIQFFTRGVSDPAQNITITDNLILRGEGDIVQGILVTDQNNTLPYENLIITGNTVLGGSYNGITVGNVNGGIVQNNVVIEYPDQPSRIQILNDENLLLRDNQSQIFLLDDPNDLRIEQNTLLNMDDIDILNHIDQWIDSHYSRVATEGVAEKESVATSSKSVDSNQSGSAVDKIAVDYFDTVSLPDILMDDDFILGPANISGMAMLRDNPIETSSGLRSGDLLTFNDVYAAHGAPINAPPSLELSVIAENSIAVTESGYREMVTDTAAFQEFAAYGFLSEPEHMF